MRELRYAVEGKQVNLCSFALDEPGRGGACHEYLVCERHHSKSLGRIHFQNGPILEVGVNGIQNEDLLAIVLDRLEGFQSGPFACEANQRARDFCSQALQALQFRTKERIYRGVEGTHAP